MKLIPELEAAECFGLPLSTFRHLRQKHGWPDVRLGRRVAFTEQQLVEIVQQHSERQRSASNVRDNPGGLTPLSWARHQQS